MVTGILEREGGTPNRYLYDRPHKTCDVKHFLLQFHKLGSVDPIDPKDFVLNWAHSFGSTKLSMSNAKNKGLNMTTKQYQRVPD